MKRRQDPKIKLTVYVSRIVAEQLDFACKDRTKNKSKLTETALSQLLSPKAEDQQDAATSRRLDRLTRDIGVINRHQQIVIESPILSGSTMFLTYSAVFGSKDKAFRGAKFGLRCCPLLFRVS